MNRSQKDNPGEVQEEKSRKRGSIKVHTITRIIAPRWLKKKKRERDETKK